MIGHSRHIDRVLETAGSPQAAALSRLAASWSRSIIKHGLHPGERRTPGRMSAIELANRREEFADLIRLAAPRLDRLFGLVGKPGCGVLLTDVHGVVMDARSNDADADTFESWGFCQGADWSEAAEGTNGVGTCLAESRHLVIHRDEHFYAHNVGISCISAPIYGPDGDLLGALDVSSARHDQNEAMNMMVSALVCDVARSIETDGFRLAYPDARIVVMPSEDNGMDALLAIDEDDLIVGATRKARRRMQSEIGCVLQPRLACELLSERHNGPEFARAERTTVLQALAQTGNNVSEAARRLGIGRATLYRRMNRLDIPTRN